MISIFIDYKLERFEKEIKHAMSFIFDSLGYSHTFITDLTKLRNNDILFIYAFAEPSVEDLRALARFYITMFIPADAELYDAKTYSTGKLKRNLKEVKLLSPTPVISPRTFKYPAENYSELEINAGKFNFDIVANVFFHLSSMEEQIDQQRNDAGCYPETASAFYKYRELPFVDNMLWLMDSMIREHSKAGGTYIVQKQNWPMGQESAAILCHSVDDLQKWDLQSLILSIADDLLMIVSFSWMQFWHQLAGKFKYMFTNYELNWNFDEFTRMEQDAGFRSTFFVASQGCAEIDYNLDDTDLLEEIRDLVKSGNEVGLLVTHDKKNRDELSTRKQILQHQTKLDDLGLKTIDSQIDPDFFVLQSNLAPAYTMNTALQDNPGFKHGISVPYRPWLKSGKASALEIPTVMRDRFMKLKRHKLMSLDDAKHLARRYLEKVSRSHGVFAMDFRIASYTDIYYAPKLYPYILALLKAGKSWVCKASELSSWWEKRSRVLIDESDYEFSVSFRDDIESLCLQINGDVKVVEIDGASASVDGNKIRFSGVKADTIAVIRLDHRK